MTSMIDEVLDIETERRGHESDEDDPDWSIGNGHEDEREQEQRQHQEAAEDAKTLIDALCDRDDEVEIATQRKISRSLRSDLFSSSSICSGVRVCPKGEKSKGIEPVKGFDVLKGLSARFPPNGFPADEPSSPLER